MSHISIAVFALLLFRFEAIASVSHDLDSTQETSTWASLGFGGGTLSTSSGFCGRIGISHQRGNEVFTIRAFRIEESITSLVEPRSPIPEEKETEFGVLYGRRFGAGAGCNAFSIGLGLVNSLHRGALLNQPPYGLNHEAVKITSVGVSLDIQIFFTPFRYFGIGLSLAGNLNPTRSFGGFLICIQAGDI